MTHKVEIEFEQSFDTNEVLPIHLGRLIIGNHIGRLFFSPEGKTILAINEKATKDRSIILTKDFADGETFFGFGLAKCQDQDSQ